MKQKSEHYQGKIETIDSIKSAGHITGFCLGNIIKYASRAGKKEGESWDSDLYKVIDYACQLRYGKWFHELKDIKKEGN